MNETNQPKRLLRSRDDRFIGGVAAGVANYFSIDPTLVRIAFALTLAFGGVGLFAYLVMLILMPLEGPADEPLPPISDGRRSLMIGGAILVGIALVIGVSSDGFGHWLFGFGPGHPFGILFWSAAVIAAVWLGVRLLGSRNGSVDDPAHQGNGGARPTTTATAPTQNAPTSGGPPDPTVPDSEKPTELMSGDDLTRGSAKRDAVPEPKPRGLGPLVGRVMLVIAVGVTALILLGCLAIFAGWTTAQFGSVPMALLLIVLGAGVILAAVRSRHQLAVWLLASALTVAIPLAIVTLADLRIEGSYGSVHEVPRRATDIPADGYRLAAGRMVIDLRKVPFRPGRELSVKVTSGFGATSVIVPDRVCVSGKVTGKAGMAYIRGRESSGVDVAHTIRRSGGRIPGLRLDGDFKLGMIEVVDATDWKNAPILERSGPRGQAIPAPSLSRARADRACATPQPRDHRKRGEA